MPEYEKRQGEKIKKETLKDLQSKHSLTRERPETPDTATNSKLHANDKVVVVNIPGTYGFAYLDPGEYLLASQAENANGLKVSLDAGKDYYFLQNTFMGAWKARTSLSSRARKSCCTK